jgi:hypothetical protein
MPSCIFTTSLITEGLVPLTRIDAKVSRAFFRALNLLSSPDAVLSDADLAARVFAYWQTRDSRPPVAVPGPTRAELLAALSRRSNAHAGLARQRNRQSASRHLESADDRGVRFGRCVPLADHRLILG